MKSVVVLTNVGLKEPTFNLNFNLKVGSLNPTLARTLKVLP